MKIVVFILSWPNAIGRSVFLLFTNAFRFSLRPLVTIMGLPTVSRLIFPHKLRRMGVIIDTRPLCTPISFQLSISGALFRTAGEPSRDSNSGHPNAVAGEGVWKGTTKDVS